MCQNLLLESVDEVKYYSLSFDESYNRIMKKGQMDLLIRFWDSAKNRAQTKYLDSSFLRKASANDIHEKFTSAAKELNPTRFLQVLSDGPNVNLTFLDIINNKIKEIEFSQLIHIGTCGFHTLHKKLVHGN